MTTQPSEGGQYQRSPYEQAQYQTRPAELAAPTPPPPATLPPVGYEYGQPAYQTQLVQGRSAAVAVIASLFIPGLGSMLNEKVGKGIGILACYVVSAILCVVLIGFILAPAVWIWGMVAANNDAHKWNRAHGIIS